MSTKHDDLDQSPASPDVPQDRRKHPCILCQKRKVKCDRIDPCTNCTKAHVECISQSTLPPKRRKKRFAEAELLARLRRYEDHLRRYGADIDAINNEANVTFAGQSSPTAPSSQGPDPMRSLSIRRSLKNVHSNVWRGVNPEFRDTEEILQGSSDDEMFESTITKTYDEIASDGGELLFSTPITDCSMRDLHPSTVHIFRLWQYFLDNVNPLTKLFHAPTVQQRVLEASADLENISKETEALMFGIYATAVTTLTDVECESMLGDTRTALLKRFHIGARQALLRAGLLRTSDMTVLQAFFLYLMSLNNFAIDPRSLFCLIGIAVRICQRMGLNHDGTTFGLLPFETEIRRRLWWNILLLDFRISELSGAGSSILDHVWTTKLPLNVNDSDLSPDMKDPPREHAGITEMLFVLQRCEVAKLMHSTRGCSTSPSENDEAVYQLQGQLERKFLQYCDPSVPLHFITSLMATTGLCKLHMGKRWRHMMSHAGDSGRPSAENDKAFNFALKMVECHNKLLASKTLGRFRWFILFNFPMPAIVCLLCVLRHRTSDDLANRAWQTLEESANIRLRMLEISDWNKHKNSHIQLAIANLTVKAWDAKEKNEPGIPTPPYVQECKQKLAAKRSPRTLSEPDTPFSETQTTAPSQYGDPFSQWLTPAPMDTGQAFDGLLMPGVMATDPAAVRWDFWNNFSQNPGPAEFMNWNIVPGFRPPEMGFNG